MNPDLLADDLADANCLAMLDDDVPAKFQVVRQNEVAVFQIAPHLVRMLGVIKAHSEVFSLNNADRNIVTQDNEIRCANVNTPGVVDSVKPLVNRLQEEFEGRTVSVFCRNSSAVLALYLLQVIRNGFGHD